MVSGSGFEPDLAGPQPTVLPLHHRADGSLPRSRTPVSAFRAPRPTSERGGNGTGGRNRTYDTCSQGTGVPTTPHPYGAPSIESNSRPPAYKAGALPLSYEGLVPDLHVPINTMQAWLRVRGSNPGWAVNSRLSYRLNEPGMVERYGVEPQVRGL